MGEHSEVRAKAARARAASQTPERRREIAINAVNKRWENARKSACKTGDNMA